MRLAFGYELEKNNERDIEIDNPTRFRSVYMIGSSSSGKSSLMETLLVQDIHEDVGFTLFDVEERLTERVLRHLLDSGRKPLVVDPTLTHSIIPLNVLHVPNGVHPHSILEGVLQSFQKAWWQSWGPRLEDFLRHALILLMEHNLTLAELPTLISNQAFRKALVDASQDERVQLFFSGHLPQTVNREYRDFVESTRNKIAAFVSNPFLASSLAANACIDFYEHMAAGTPIVINLPERVLGESGKLMGMLLVSRLFQASLRRQEGATPHIIYADEFQNFASKSFVDLVTRARKRSVGAVMAHQTCAQPPFDRNPDFLSAILGTTAVHVVMLVGREDAERFAKEIFPATGTQIKQCESNIWGDGEIRQRYTVQEERELQCQELETQKPRECFIKVKTNSGTKVYVAEAYEVPEPDATSVEADALAYAAISEHGISASEVERARQNRLARFRRNFPKEQ